MAHCCVNCRTWLTAVLTAANGSLLWNWSITTMILISHIFPHGNDFTFSYDKVLLTSRYSSSPLYTKLKCCLKLPDVRNTDENESRVFSLANFFPHTDENCSWFFKFLATFKMLRFLSVTGTVKRNGLGVFLHWYCQLSPS